MVWLVIVGLFILLWAVSVGKIHLGSSLNSKTTFLNDNGSAGLPSRKNVLFVIAHPDDETMFFSPTINFLTSRGHNVYILCLSTGNADGIGNIRKEELYLASVVLKVPSQKVKVVDHPDLQDGFHKVWNCNLLETIIKEEVDSNAIDVVSFCLFYWPTSLLLALFLACEIMWHEDIVMLMSALLYPAMRMVNFKLSGVYTHLTILLDSQIITFDNYGVSGHCNHRDVHQGVQSVDLDLFVLSLRACIC